jgi:hypothetical protein
MSATREEEEEEEGYLPPASIAMDPTPWEEQ